MFAIVAEVDNGREASGGMRLLVGENETLWAFGRASDNCFINVSCRWPIDFERTRLWVFACGEGVDSGDVVGQWFGD